MSEPRDDPGPMGEPIPNESAASEPTGDEPAAAPTPRYRVAIGLAGAALLLVVLVGAGLLWAPSLSWRASAPPDRGLAARIDRLMTRQQQDRQQTRQAIAATNAALQRLDRRIGASEARPGAAPADIADLRQQLAKLSTANADLATRVAALDQFARNRAASERTDTGLLLVLLQIRDAVAAGRPFAAEYEALVALAPAPSDIAAAAAPLAEPAKAGVASLRVLTTRLRDLAATLAAAPAPPAGGGWGNAVLARLHGLVTIRHIDEVGTGSGPPVGVNGAERALAGGDLAAAVAALDGLTGAPAEAARSWLRSAKQRLAVEAALRRIEALVSARLTAAASRPADAGSPR
ncbi:MAG TPA: mitofilin family membrane protein [Stellaceae bacterium]|nr:mitofilin family membrane protein [Stellaceae bacterium]